jgi:hypothetical protein
MGEQGHGQLGRFHVHGRGGAILILVTLFAIGSYHVAGRMGRSRALWVILTIIPIVNLFFSIYAFFAVLLYVLDRLVDEPDHAHGVVDGASCCPSWPTRRGTGARASRSENLACSAPLAPTAIKGRAPWPSRPG